MRKKIGFTLAEVLITLGIVGVVSALTIPSMTQDVQKQKIGPTLAKAVNTLENANASLLQYKEARNLIDACDETEGTIENMYMTCLLKNSGLTGFSLPGKTYDGSSYNNCVQTKDGIAFCTGNLGLSGPFNPTRQYYGKAIPIVIDINGPDNKPNKFSKDAFSFKVDLQGQIIPTGGRQERNYKDEADQGPLWEETCNSSSVTDEHERDCTGSIVDNGWKVIYPY